MRKLNNTTKDKLYLQSLISSGVYHDLDFNCADLQLNNTYTITSISKLFNDKYIQVDDIMHGYAMHHFKLLSEIRKEKLNRLCLK